MNWHLSHRADCPAVALADRHYSRKRPGSPQFVGPYRALVLLTAAADALWVSVWPKPEYTQHAWPGAWMCSCFRNEGTILSSLLIRQAVAVTRYRWRDIPAHGLITFVDARKVCRKRDPGRCFRKAGFREVGRTKDRGLVVLQLLEADMPEPVPPLHANGTLFSDLPALEAMS